MKIDCHLHLFADDAQFVEERLRLMDAADVAVSVLQPLPGLPFKGHVCGDNAEVQAAIRHHPDRLIGAIHLDPRDPAWRDTLARGRDAGCRCVKMWPPMGYYPDEPRFAPVFAALDEARLPVLFHCGLTNMGPEYESRYADPMRMEALPRRCPNITFILAHWGGLGTFAAAWALMKANPNVWLDASGRRWSWPGAGLYRLYEAVTPVDFRRVVWGTDNLDEPAAGIAADAALLAEIGKSNFADAFFGGNAQRLLGL